MATDLQAMIKNLMSRVVKKSALNGKSTAEIVALELLDDNLKGYSSVELGFSAEEAMRKLQGKISAQRRMDFRMECRTSLAVIIRKLQEKSPLKYPVVVGAKFIDPRVMKLHPSEGKHAMKKVLRVFVQCKQFEESSCDEVLSQYNSFVETVASLHSEEFTAFNPSETRLDDFFVSRMAPLPEFKLLWQLVRKVLVLSHGQAAVERGFSANLQCLDNNLAEESLCARRIICSEISSVGGLSNFVVTKDLIVQCRASHQRYKHYLSEKKITEKEKDLQKRKRAMEKEKLLQKRQKLDGHLKALDEAIDLLDDLD